MSYNLVNSTTGELTRVAGLSGSLVPSVALYQTEIPYIPATAAGDTFEITVVLATPMPDADYVVNVTNPNGGLEGKLLVQNVLSKGTTGFIIRGYNLSGTDIPANTFAVRWQAFKLMTDEVHEADAIAIAQNTTNFASAFSEVTSYAVGDYVTYNNALYRCTTAHTAGVWVAGHFTQVTVGGDFVSQSKLHTLDVRNNEQTLDRIQRLKNLITTNVTGYGSYIMFVELAGDDYGQIVLSRRLTTDVVRGTVTIGVSLYVISGTMSALIITAV